jgi:hypothetical protein
MYDRPAFRLGLPTVQCRAGYFTTSIDQYDSMKSAYGL